MDYSSLMDRAFVSVRNGVTYGLHEPFAGQLPEGFSRAEFGEPFFHDECGNLFTELASGELGFWDHETDQVEVLASSLDELFHLVSEYSPTEDAPESPDVVSAWIDPDFAREQGIDAPDDGWIKRRWLKKKHPE